MTKLLTTIKTKQNTKLKTNLNILYIINENNAITCLRLSPTHQMLNFVYEYMIMFGHIRLVRSQ